MQLNRYIIAALLVAASPAFAAEPHSIDLTAVVLDQAGKLIPDPTQATADDPKCAQCRSLTLGTAIATAMLAPHKEDQSVPTIDKARRGALALKIADAKEITLSAADIAKIEPLLDIWPPLILARIVPMLDPNQDLSWK